MKKTDIKKVGISHEILAESALYPDLYVVRVYSQYKDLYKVMYEDNELTAEVSGKFRFEVKRLSDYPAVGDYVMIDRSTNSHGNAIIHHVLSRKSAFVRKAAGTSNDSQIIATNIDTVFICMSLNNDFNLRRLERYLSIAWDSGAVPVIVLTKSDLCEDICQKLAEVNSVAIGVDVLVTSSSREEGYKQILAYIKEGLTIAFIGSSGVGKSTLINCLIGENRIKTNVLSNDDKGRHTTTRRELIRLENGGMVIDTPGMREMGLERADLSKTFADIDELATKCKYHDCCHKSEPGCAVQKAIAEGKISADRLQSYEKLKKEAKYEVLNSRQIEAVKINEMFKEVGGIKNARKLAKSKNKR
ncbi:MAG: ribosome small subunit-dependent GTPase A [Clostridia bacterium]|nr:ribosome small subunit-dependent GTPase A [Clostridia bacterium]